MKIIMYLNIDCCIRCWSSVGGGVKSFCWMNMNDTAMIGRMLKYGPRKIVLPMYAGSLMYGILSVHQISMSGADKFGIKVSDPIRATDSRRKNTFSIRQ